MSGLQVLRSNTLDEEILVSTVPVVVEVGADWCPPCRAMDPVLDALAVEYEDRLRVYRVDADVERDIVARFDVLGLPTLLVFAEGQLVKRLVGARSKSRLVGELADLLS